MAAYPLPRQEWPKCLLPYPEVKEIWVNGCKDGGGFDLNSKGWEAAHDTCAPTIEKVEVNSKIYTVLIDRHTKRATSAFTEEKPWDPRRFQSEQDYQNFLAGN
jgi:hypothetical protein